MLDRKDILYFVVAFVVVIGIIAGIVAGGSKSFKWNRDYSNKVQELKQELILKKSTKKMPNKPYWIMGTYKFDYIIDNDGTVTKIEVSKVEEK